MSKLSCPTPDAPQPHSAECEVMTTRGLGILLKTEILIESLFLAENSA